MVPENHPEMERNMILKKTNLTMTIPIYNPIGVVSLHLYLDPGPIFVE